MSEDKKPSNEIRIGFKSKPKEIISQCEKLLKEDKVKDLHLSAVSTSISDLVITVEILKTMFKGLYQKSVFSTISPRVSKKKKKDDANNNKRLCPRLEIVLSMEKPKEEKEDSKEISEEERKILIETLEKQKEAFIKMRKTRRFRRPLRKNRKLGYNRRGYSYSNRRNTFIKRRPVYNNTMRFRKSPIRGRTTAKKFKEPRKISENKGAPATAPAVKN